MEPTFPSRAHSFQRKPYSLVEAVIFCLNWFLSFQWKPFFQEKPLVFSVSISFQWKLLLLVDGIFFIRSYLFYWKSFILVESTPFSFVHKAFFFCWKSLPAVETNLFRKSLFFLVEAWWKLHFLIKSFPFSRSHCFQWFSIFTSRSYQKLPEHLNINDSLRSLTMANLSCIHIHGKVLEPSQASGV